MRTIRVGLVLITLTGCASMNDVVKAKSEGTLRKYPVTCDQAYDISRGIFLSEGARGIDDHRSEGYMLSRLVGSGFTWGTLLGAWVEPAKPGECLVTVVTKRRMTMQALTDLTESTFHDRFAQAVAAMPATPPSAETTSSSQRASQDAPAKSPRPSASAPPSKPRDVEKQSSQEASAPLPGPSGPNKQMSQAGLGGSPVPSERVAKSRPTNQNASGEVARPRSYALLFASDKYDHWGRLENPIHDAITVEQELKERYGFETRLERNPTSDRIVRVLFEYVNGKYPKPALGRSDQLFVFFAGHGDYIEATTEGFLVGKDSRLPQDDPAHSSYVAHTRLTSILSKMPAGHVFFVLDSCFSGAFDQRIMRGRSRGGEENPYAPVSLAESIKRKLKYRTRLYLTSGGKEYVPDGRPGEHSPFVRQLLKALRSDSAHGYLTIHRLVEYFDRVKPEPRHGEFEGHEPAGDFVFVPNL